MFSESLKNQNKNFVVNIRDSEFGKLVVRWREWDNYESKENKHKLLNKIKMAYLDTI